MRESITSALPVVGVGELQGARLPLPAEDEQREMRRVDPHVIADWFDVLEHEPRIGAVQIESPEPLRPIGFGANDRERLAVRRHERRVLAFSRVRELRHRLRGEVVAVDVRLLAVPVGGEQDAGAVGQKARLIVVARAVADVDHRADDGFRFVETPGDQVDLGRRRLLLDA